MSVRNKNRESSETKDGRTAISGPPKPNSSSERKGNSVWQSLALRPAVIQPKLTVSQPGDVYEQEADHFADSAMRTPSAAPKESSLDTVAGVHASMATIEQATMPYAITALKNTRSCATRRIPC